MTLLPTDGDWADCYIDHILVVLPTPYSTELVITDKLSDLSINDFLKDVLKDKEGAHGAETIQLFPGKALTITMMTNPVFTAYPLPMPQKHNWALSA